MTKVGPYEVHPAAEAFPMMSDDELKALAEDIKLNGLQNPIVLNHDGTVLLDGRNRYEACELANADPVEIRLGPHYTETQLVDYIVSANIRRRHLNQGQLAMIALNLESFFAEEAKKRQLAGLKWSQDTVVSKHPNEAGSVITWRRRSVYLLLTSLWPRRSSVTRPIWPRR